MNPNSRIRFFCARFLSPLLIVSIGWVPSFAWALRPMPDKTGLEERLAPRSGLEESVPSWVYQALPFLRKISQEQLPTYLAARDPNALAEPFVRFLSRDENRERIPEVWAFVNSQYPSQEGKLIVAESFQEASKISTVRGLARLLLDVLQNKAIAEKTSRPFLEWNRRQFVGTTGRAVLGLVSPLKGPLAEAVVRKLFSSGFDLWGSSPTTPEGREALRKFNETWGLDITDLSGLSALAGKPIPSTASDYYLQNRRFSEQLGYIDGQFLTKLRWNHELPPLKVVAAEIIGRVRERFGGNVPLTLKGLKGMRRYLISDTASDVLRDLLSKEVSQGPITTQFLDSLVVQLSSPNSPLSQKVVQEARETARSNLLELLRQDREISDQEESSLLDAHVNRLTGNPDAHEWWTAETVAAARAMKEAGHDPYYEKEVVVETGLEEHVQNTWAAFEQAMQKRPSVVVLDADVISQRVGLEEFAARLPRQIGKVILYQKQGSGFIPQELVRRNPNLIVADGIVDLATTLVGLEEAETVTFLGNPDDAQKLTKILPHSMHVAFLDPKTGLEEILRIIGVPPDLLKEMNASGLEEQLERLARSRAA